MVSIKRILIPTDVIDCAKISAYYALTIAEKLGTAVQCLFVFDYNSLTSLKFPDTEEYIRETCDKMVNEIVEMGKKHNVEVGPVTGTGDPANYIISISGDYDLIVMGTVGRTRLAHALMGSVAEKTVRLAKCPVLVVKDE